MLDVEGFILVGGASSRMGTDKSQLVFQGQTSIQRIATQLSAITSAIALVGGRSDNDLQFKHLADIHERWGALGGIHAALKGSRADWAAIIACDLPMVTADLFVRLRSFAVADTDAVVPIQPCGRVQPLCALYRKETCLPEIDRLIARGEHSPQSLLASVKTRWAEPPEYADLKGAENFFLNVNTPADYEKAKALLAPSPNQQ